MEFPGRATHLRLAHLPSSYLLLGVGSSPLRVSSSFRHFDAESFLLHGLPVAVAPRKVALEVVAGVRHTPFVASVGLRFQQECLPEVPLQLGVPHLLLLAARQALVQRHRLHAGLVPVLFRLVLGLPLSPARVLGV